MAFISSKLFIFSNCVLCVLIFAAILHLEIIFFRFFGRDVYCPPLNNLLHTVYLCSVSEMSIFHLAVIFRAGCSLPFCFLNIFWTAVNTTRVTSQRRLIYTDRLPIKCPCCVLLCFLLYNYVFSCLKSHCSEMVRHG